MGRVKDSDLLENLQEKGVWSGAAPGEKRKKKHQKHGEKGKYHKKKRGEIRGDVVFVGCFVFSAERPRSGRHIETGLMIRIRRIRVYFTLGPHQEEDMMR